MKPHVSFSVSIVLILLSLVSLVTLFSVAPEKVPQQATFLLVGFLIFLYLGAQDSALYKNAYWISYGLSIALLLITLIFGSEIRGATRSIQLFGLQLQAAELVKPLLIISYAGFMSEWSPKTLKNIARNLALAAIPILLIFAQPDLGTVVVHSVIWMGMMLIAGTPIKAMLSGLATIIAGISFAPRLLQDYQLRRLTSFFDPTRDPLGSGYNVIQSLIAVGSGKIIGKGLGKGTQSQLRFLPERHTDFIFASIAEEFGFVGAIAVLSLFVYLLVKILMWLDNSHTLQGKLLLTGVFTYLCFQAFLNIGVNLGIAPVTGVTLPLVSAGGSSVLATFIALAIAHSESLDIRNTPSMEIK